MTPEKANQIAAEFICEGMQYGDPTPKLAQLFVTYCTPAAGRARDDGYQLGNNCAGETAAQVANFITGDLRVLLKAYPEVVDKISDSIANAIREAAQAACGKEKKA